MHSKLRIPTRPEGVHARIGPDIGSVPTVLAEFDVVDMGGCALLVNKNKLVLRAIKAPHAAVGFDPNAYVLEFRVDAICRVLDFSNVAPIHANGVDGAIAAEGGKVLERAPEEGRVLSSGHFSRSHRKFVVLDFT